MIPTISWGFLNANFVDSRLFCHFKKLYTLIPVTRTANSNYYKAWKGCHPMANETPQMTNVRTESKTMRVVADISLDTEIPAKLEKAIKNTVPLNAIPIKKRKLLKIHYLEKCTEFSIIFYFL